MIKLFSLNLLLLPALSKEGQEVGFVKTLNLARKYKLLTYFYE
jgi:hypothetical protein